VREAREEREKFTRPVVRLPGMARWKDETRNPTEEVSRREMGSIRQ
jgi:hypothetical protein